MGVEMVVGWCIFGSRGGVEIIVGGFRDGGSWV